LSDADRAEIARLLDSMTCADLGLNPAVEKGAPGRSDGAIFCQNIYSGDDFELVIFLFPAGAALPVHDHPGMSVFSRVLYGCLQMTSYNWLLPAPSLARLDGAFLRLPAL